MIDAYPLCWPEGYKRTKSPIYSRFKNNKSVAKGRDEVIQEIKRLGAVNPIISSNIEIRQDGLPYSNRRNPTDAGVAVYFKLNGEQRVLACDAFTRAEDNLWAIAKTIDAMRGIDRWGCSEMLNRMFTGFVALPERTETWYEVLGVTERADAKEIRSMYLQLCKLHHPDRGGDAQKMARINSAYDYAQKQGLVA